MFIPHADLTGAFVRRGVPGEKIVSSGIPVSSAYAAAVDKADARVALDLPASLPCFLVMTGGEGCGNAPELTKRLLEQLRGRDARILVLTGRNGSLLKQMETRFAGDARVLAVPFTDQVPLYMDACDVLLTKPGGVSSTEAAVKGIPMVHTPPIPGVETQNAQFFSERGMSVYAPSEESAAENAVRLSLDPQQRARMLAAQQQYLSAAAAEKIAARILGRGEPAAN